MNKLRLKLKLLHRYSVPRKTFVIHFMLGLILFGAGSLTCSVSKGADKKEREVPFDQKPYQVKIEFVFSDTPEFNSDYRNHLKSDLSEVILNTYGEMWQPTIAEDKTLLPRSIEGIKRLDETRLVETYPVADYDKVIFCTFGLKGHHLQLACREWDTNLQTLSQIEEGSTIDPRETPFLLSRMMNRVFRPLIRIDSIDERTRTAYITLQAGEFPARHTDMAQLVEGDLIQPYLSYFNKKKENIGLQKIDWNYLKVLKIDRGRLECRYISGIRTGLTSKSNRRMKKLGLRMRPYTDQTLVRLALSNNPDIPLVSHQVTAITKTLARDESDIPPDRYLSDRKGFIEIPYAKEKPIQWLYVNSGNALIGRIPVAPGTNTTVDCLLSDDSMRLEFEGQVEQLKGQIIEIIAKRASILAEARQKSEKAKWDEMNAKIAELEKLNGIEELERQLNEIRVNSTEKARKRNNRTAVRRIEKLSADTSKKINQYLQMNKINEMIDILKQNEVAGKKKAAEEAEAARQEEENQ